MNYWEIPYNKHNMHKTEHTLICAAFISPYFNWLGTYLQNNELHPYLIPYVKINSVDQRPDIRAKTLRRKYVGVNLYNLGCGSGSEAQETEIKTDSIKI